MAIRKLRKYFETYYVSIPKGLIETIGWEVGDSVEIKFEGGSIVIRRIESEGESTN